MAHNLQRFLDAQASSYAAVRSELTAGQKRTHWMWFIFPQIKGLGSSATARLYAIESLEEASAYLAHPILGPRLRTCTALVNAIPNPDLARIFGFPDHLKYHSSVTLFAQAAADSTRPEDAVFAQSLKLFFADQLDPDTIARLKR